MQTTLNPQKSKDVQSISHKTVHSSIMVNEWEIYDAQQAQNSRPQSNEENKSPLRELDLDNIVKEIEAPEMLKNDQSNLMSIAGSTSVFDHTSEGVMGESRLSLNTKPQNNSTSKSKTKDEISMVMINLILAEHGKFNG
jgi:hypothetical protein